MKAIERETAFARWAEEARQRADALARSTLTPAAPRTPAAPPALATPARPEISDVLERAPRLFGREIPIGLPRLEESIESLVSEPVLPSPSFPSPPRTDVLPRLPASPSRARVDADLDRQQLLEAFGPAQAPPVVASVSASVSPNATAIAAAARTLVAVKRLDWDAVAPTLLGAKLGTIAETAGQIEARALRVQDVLSAVESRHAPTIVGCRMAGGFLEKAAFKASVARELAKLAPGVGASLERMAAARQELGDARQSAVDAEATLRELSSRAAETPWALPEIREIQRAASSAQRELGQTESQAQMLGAMDAGSLLASELPDASSPGATARTSVSADTEFTEDDLARIGTGLDPNKPPAQTEWSEQMVNTVCDLGRQQGGVTDEQGGRNLELAKVILGSSEGETSARTLEAVDLAAVLKMAGVDLAKVDPSQLQSAARYVSGATTLEDQQQKLRKAIDNFQVLEKIGLPKMSRQQMADALWGVAKVPGHALTKLSDAEVSKKLQEVLSAVNAGPGKSEIKIGKHNLKIEVGQNGQVTKSSCKKPGFFSKLAKIAKIVTPIALTVMSFIPVTAPFALAAQGVLSMVNAVKSKSFLGVATAAASIVGGAGAIVGKFAGAAAKAADTASKAAQAMKTAATAARVAKVASSAGRALQGISSLKSGNVIGGLASIGSGIASGISTFAAGAAKGLGKFADNLNHLSTKLSAVGTGVASFDGYKRASAAVSDAKDALQAAQASGDARAIADAQKRLNQAESQKRAAVIGGAVGTASAASALVENRSLFADESKAISPAQTLLQSRLRLAAQGLGVAQDVVARDYAGAAVAALSFGSTINSKGKNGRENRFNDVANMAQAGLGYYQAEKARSLSNQAVSEAQARLEAAKLSGDQESIRQAAGDLKAARSGAESALMGGIAAGESLLGTARDIGERYHEEKAAKQEKVKTAQKAASDSTIAGQKTAEGLASLADDPSKASEVREAACDEQAKLKAADKDFQKAIAAAKGDPDAIDKAVAEYESVRTAAVDHVIEATRAAATVPAPDAESPGFASLRRPQNIASARVTRGVTVWEVSQRTGVPVERILEFNAQSGNPLDPKNLQIGQQILVPMDAEDIKFKAKTAEEVRDLKLKAAAEKRQKESLAVPRILSTDEPAPPPEDIRSKTLGLLANDRAVIQEDIKAAVFKALDPTTWLDTKEEKARSLARDTFKQAVDRLETVLHDQSSTTDQIRAALVDKNTALNLYSRARGMADQRNENANYLTPVAELYRNVVADPFHEQAEKAADLIDHSALSDLLKTVAKAPIEILDKEVSFDFKGAIQSGQDAVHSVTRAMSDLIEESGLPAPLADAASLPLRATDSLVNLVGGADKHVVSIVEGLGNVVVHPADTVSGLAQLGERAMETNPQGRTALFLKDLATGQFKTPDEALNALRDSLDPVLMAKAGFSLGEDLLKGVFSEAIRLTKEGKYDEAAGNVSAQIVEILVGVGLTKLGKAAEIATTASRAGQVDSALQATIRAARAVDTLEEASKAGRLPALGLEEAAQAERLVDQAAARAAWEAQHQAQRIGRTVNPLGGSTNCVNCTIAADATLSGRPAAALLSAAKPIAVLEQEFGAKFVDISSRSAIVKEMTRAGSGARGIVFGSRGPGQAGHVFNVVNQRGVIRFLDAQTGEIASFAGFKRLKLLRTS